MARLGEMFYRRCLEGNSHDPLFSVMEERLPALAVNATQIVAGNFQLYNRTFPDESIESVGR